MNAQLFSIPSDEFSSESMYEKISSELAEKSYTTVDGFLNESGVNALIKTIDDSVKNGGFKKAGIGTAHQFQVNNAIRGDFIHWINLKETEGMLKGFVDRIYGLLTYINRTCFLGLKDFEMHYAYYPQGAGYKRHLDQLKANDHRRLTFILYLNKGWQIKDGGLLRMYLKNSNNEEIPFDIAPLAGRLVVFRSDLIEHEVLACTRPRYSMTGWMLDQNSELTFL